MMIPINAVVALFFLSLVITATPTRTYHRKRSGDETKADKIKRLKLEVQNLQKMLEQINTEDDVTVSPKPPATTVRNVPRKDSNADVKNQADQRHVENVLKSLTAKDIRFLTNLRDSFQHLKEQNHNDGYKTAPDSNTRYSDIFNHLYRSVKNDADNYQGVASSLGSHRVYVPRRPLYRDLADRQLNKARYADDKSRDRQAGYSERKRTLESRTDRLKRIEGKLLDVLQDGLRNDGITLEDLIADLDRVKEKDNRKRTLVSDEEAELESLRHKLRTH